MGLLAIVVLSGILLWAAYRIYGDWLARLLQLDDTHKTPAVTQRDGVDFEPIAPGFLMSQHFSAIAAAGPIVGPILAGVMFGWAPTLVWIILGSIFVGGVHDFTALVASIRHQGRSIADVVREHMTRRSYVLFLIFIWIALVYIIVAFTDIVAGSFVGKQTLENGLTTTGGGIASSSLLYLALPLVMGVLLRYTKLSLNLATAIFLPLVAVAIWVGQYIPLDLAVLLGLTDNQAQKVWDVLLLGYCFVASVVPVWLLLQPRGHLGGYFLMFVLAGGALGIAFGGAPIQYPAFTGWSAPGAGGTMVPLVPMLFITVACGACSGFHSIIASGTTSKQLRCESDAKPIGYGAMLLEGMVAVVSLCCVMLLTREAATELVGKPNYIYAVGLSRFLEVIHIPAAFGISFGLLAFTTFVYDTLDVCTRLGRYIIEELTGWKDRVGRFVSTALTAGVPLLFVMQTSHDPSGNVIPAWKVFWALFGASNQLLAALTLVGVTVWLHHTYGRPWVWWVTGLPTVLMYTMSAWALWGFIANGFFGPEGFHLAVGPVPYAAALLLGLALLMLVEAIRVFTQPRSAEPQDAVAQAA